MYNFFWLARHLENFKIKLHYFQERLSPLRNNFELNVSVTSKRTYFLKNIHEGEDSQFYFLYYQSSF